MSNGRKLRIRWVVEGQPATDRRTADRQLGASSIGDARAAGFQPRGTGNPSLEQKVAETRFEIAKVRRSIKDVMLVRFWAQCEGRQDLVELIDAELDRIAKPKAA